MCIDNEANLVEANIRQSGASRLRLAARQTVMLLWLPLYTDRKSIKMAGAVLLLCEDKNDCHSS